MRKFNNLRQFFENGFKNKFGGYCGCLRFLLCKHNFFYVLNLIKSILATIYGYLRPQKDNGNVLIKLIMNFNEIVRNEKKKQK